MIELQTSVKQDDTTRTRTPKPGYLNLSNVRSARSGKKRLQWNPYCKRDHIIYDFSSNKSPNSCWQQQATIGLQKRGPHRFFLNSKMPQCTPNLLRKIVKNVIV